MKTKYAIAYTEMPYGKIATIPKGTPVIPADNLPQGGYWAEKWEGMSAIQESWLDNYGFHVAQGAVCNE
tara:strand:+ start:168 stop:374 length:207 start_codon:yes stop_codon:yes gene_type:complete